jgi:hypothetical protein
MLRVDQYLIAKEDVPDMLEPGVEFLKRRKYRVIKISETFVTLENAWLDHSNFSLDPKNTANNYLWTWFREESIIEKISTFLKSMNLSVFGLAIFWLSVVAFATMLEKRIEMLIFLVAVWLYVWLEPIYKNRRKKE